jgi:hypothetical protein
MRWAGSLERIESMIMSINYYFLNLNRREHLGNINVDGKLKLNRT